MGVYGQLSGGGGFVQLYPENKKSFTGQDVREIKAKLFIVKNFGQLKAGNEEYAQALSVLTGKKFIRPAPAMRPSEYFDLIL